MIILSIINQQGPNYFLLNQKLVSEFILKLILFMNKCIFFTIHYAMYICSHNDGYLNKSNSNIDCLLHNVLNQ